MAAGFPSGMTRRWTVFGCIAGQKCPDPCVNGKGPMSRRINGRSSGYHGGISGRRRSRCRKRRSRCCKCGTRSGQQGSRGSGCPPPSNTRCCLWGMGCRVEQSRNNSSSCNNSGVDYRTTNQLRRQLHTTDSDSGTTRDRRRLDVMRNLNCNHVLRVGAQTDISRLSKSVNHANFRSHTYRQKRAREHASLMGRRVLKKPHVSFVALSARPNANLAAEEGLTASVLAVGR